MDDSVKERTLEASRHASSHSRSPIGEAAGKDLKQVIFLFLPKPSETNPYCHLPFTSIGYSGYLAKEPSFLPGRQE